MQALFDRLRHSQISQILICAAALYVVFGYWKAQDLEREVRKLSTLLQQIETEPQEVVEDYWPMWLAENGERLLMSASSASKLHLGWHSGWHSEWVRNKSSKASLRVSPRTNDGIPEDLVIADLAQILESEELLEVWHPSGSAECSKSFSGVSFTDFGPGLLWIKDMTPFQPDASDKFRASFLLEKRSEGEMRNVLGGLECRWSRSLKLLTPLPYGSFKAHFPKLARLYSSKKIPEIQDEVATARETSRSKTNKILGIEVETRNIAWLIVFAVPAISVHMLAFLSQLRARLDVTPLDCQISWVCLISNGWARSLTFATILVLPVLTVFLCFWGVGTRPVPTLLYSTPQFVLSLILFWKILSCSRRLA